MKWNNLIYALLFSGLGAFSYLVLVNYTDLTPRIADALYSRGAFIFFIAAFNVLGYTTLHLSSWINNQPIYYCNYFWIFLSCCSLFNRIFFTLLCEGRKGISRWTINGCLWEFSVRKLLV